MLSGIWPRGSSSAPGSGNTGMISGNSAGPRFSALIGIGCLLSHGRACSAMISGEQDRREPLATVDGGLVRAAPGFEELHQLLARAVIVPFAVALDDLEQMIGCLLALARSVHGDRQNKTHQENEQAKQT